MTQVDSAPSHASPLSQPRRVACALLEPSRLFNDIHDGHRSWWLPFILVALASYLFLGAVVQKVGIDQTVQNQIRINPKAQERLAQASPEQNEKAALAAARVMEATFMVSPLLALVYAVSISAVFLFTINFAFGGRARFAEVLAVSMYAWLPSLFKVLLGICVLWFQPPELFNIANFSPTNPAALFLDPASTSSALYTLASQLDLITIWVLLLFSIGLSTVAAVKRSSGFVTVFGWWAIYVVVRVGIAAVFS
jgi:hypothetical protein